MTASREWRVHVAGDTVPTYVRTRRAGARAFLVASARATSPCPSVLTCVWTDSTLVP